MIYYSDRDCWYLGDRQMNIYINIFYFVVEIEREQNVNTICLHTVHTRLWFQSTHWSNSTQAHCNGTHNRLRSRSYIYDSSQEEWTLWVKIKHITADWELGRSLFWIAINQYGIISRWFIPLSKIYDESAIALEWELRNQTTDRLYTDYIVLCIIASGRCIHRLMWIMGSSLTITNPITKKFDWKIIIENKKNSLLFCFLFERLAKNNQFSQSQ